MKHNMIFRISATTALLTLSLSLAPLPALAVAKDVVGSKYDAKVQSTNGNCVRTKWQTGDDACAPKAPPPAPMPEPAPYVPPPKPKPVVQAPPPPPPPPPPMPHTVIKEEARTIYFDSGKSIITKGGERKLDTLASVLKGAHDIQRVEIVGYADPMGKSAANMALSERRASAVQNYLNQHGYMKTSLAKTKAVGDTQASAPCPKNMKRAKKISCLVTDRKVEVQVIYETQQY